MIRSVQQLRVFLATPSDLDPERRDFAETVAEVNRIKANPLGLELRPVGWEDLPAGPGRPQDQINPLIDDCYLFILALWKRWGSPTGLGDRVGIQEEFDYAAELSSRSCGFPIISIYFKDLLPDELSDPGSQLQAVLDFRRRIELSKRYLAKTFDRSECSSRSWKATIRHDLCAALDRIAREAAEDSVRSSSGVPRDGSRSTALGSTTVAVKAEDRASLAVFFRSVPALVRAEGIAEKAGAIYIHVAGGPSSQSEVMPITIAVSTNVNITNRIENDNLTDAIASVRGLPGQTPGKLVASNRIEFLMDLPLAAPGDTVVVKITGLRVNCSQLGIVLNSSNERTIEAWISLSASVGLDQPAALAVLGLTRSATGLSMSISDEPFQSVVSLDSDRNNILRIVTLVIQEQFAGAFGDGILTVQVEDIPDGAALEAFDTGHDAGERVARLDPLLRSGQGSTAGSSWINCPTKGGFCETRWILTSGIRSSSVSTVHIKFRLRLEALRPASNIKFSLGLSPFSSVITASATQPIPRFIGPIHSVRLPV